MGTIGRVATGPRIFEHLLTAALESKPVQSEEVTEIAQLEPSMAPERLARHIAREVERALGAVHGDQNERSSRQIAIVNDILARLREIQPPGPPSGEDLSPPPRLLLSIHDGVPPPRTELPFAVSALLTRARGEPALGHELALEIATADRIDALVSFVTRGGVRALREALDRHAQAGRQFRLLTTTYTGATEADAVESLARLPHTRVRVSFDARRTRLHAKAWLFSRQSSLDTAYVGSANLSSSALFHGHEWMVKLSAADLPALIEKFRGTFETLWNDPEFEPYDPDDDAHRERLRAALASERGGTRESGLRHTYFTLTPYPFQSEILDRLEAERRLHGRMRNLVVAATGTGKTVVAAFDYQRQIGADGLWPRLLFLAHRQEILTQAIDTFRNILRDGAFGVLLADGASPTSHAHLFATIQSFNSRGLLERCGPDYWSHVVIDECHHAPAASYRAIAQGIRPRVLVGLTATPERTDGQSLLPDFDGHIAAELRLWQALERQLLAPFEYYGISDNTDLTKVRWTRGAYVLEELDNLYTGNDLRAELVVEQTIRRVGNVRAMRAVGFCVSVAHAQFMARKFSEVGIPSVAIHGASDLEERSDAPGRLERREVNVLFTCDLYNEGVDLPSADTLLFLRPTSSATLFLQQLGRGLRLHPGKETCLVLDFIGRHREDFRFDKSLSAMTGIPRGALRKAVEDGFPLLPSGCHVELDRVARDQIMASLKRALRGGMNRLTDELRVIVGREGSQLALRDFLRESGRQLDEVFTKDVSWSRLRRTAGLEVPAAGPRETEITAKLAYLLHLDEPERLTFYRTLLAEPASSVRTDPLSKRRLLMLAYQLYHSRTEFFTAEGIVELLRAHPAVASEIVELCEVLEDEVALATSAPLPSPSWPLAIHRRYGRREVLAAVGRWNESAKPESREGLVRLEDEKTELLFVTLDKAEKRFSATTRYEDYAISADLFHWQTQSGVSPDSPTGRRYAEQDQNDWRFLLFVRPTIDDTYTYLGPARYIEHRGSRPMSITWRLEIPIPGRWLPAYERLVA